MATFLNIRTTDAGKALLADVHAGDEELTITHVAFGSGVWEQADHDAMSLTVLKNEMVRVVPSDGKQEGSEAEILCVLTNEDLDTGFALTEIGIIAQRKDNSEVLYMADGVPPVQSTWISSKEEHQLAVPITLRIVCSSSSNVDIRVKAGAPLTGTELDLHDTAAAAHADIRQELASHTHTPAQAGLGNLPNTKSDSAASASSDQLATSKAVKTVMDAVTAHKIADDPHNVLPQVEQVLDEKQLATSKDIKTAMDAVAAHKAEDDPHNVMVQVEQALDEKQSYDEVLREQVNKLISGNAVGTEGKWKFTYRNSITINNRYVATYDVGPITLLLNSDIASDIRVGSYDQINSDIQAFTVGDSGRVYSAYSTGYLASTNEVRDVFIHPKHCDVQSDFTIGNTYPVYVFQESTDAIDQQTGELDVVEYVVGSRALGVTGIFSELVGDVSDDSAPDNYGFNTHGKVVTVTGRNVSSSGSIYFYTGKNIVTNVAGAKVRVLGTVSSGQLGSVRALFRKADGSVGVTPETLVNSTGAFDITVEIPSEHSGAAVTSLKEMECLSHDGGALTINDLHFTLLETESLPFVRWNRAVLNVGYWKGKNWQSQLLYDATSYENGRRFKLSRKSIGANNATMVDTLEVMKADKTWQIFTPAYPTGKFQWAGDTEGNTVLVNTKHSYVSLGYVSEEDMLLNSAVRIMYKTKARCMRSAQSEAESVAISEEVFFPNLAHADRGPYLCSDLINNAPVAPHSWLATTGAKISYSTHGPKGRRLDVTHYTPHSELARGATNPACAVRFMLSPVSGTLHLVGHFKEMIHDADWGDSGTLESRNDVVTSTDDNGNVVLTGCMSYNTGIPA